jgi:hypothetical protein
MIAMVITAMALGAFSQAVVSTRKLGRVNEEQSLALQAANRMLVTMQSETFAQVFARYNATGTDDPGGAGTAPGANFAVPGLEPREGDADGMPGQILFPNTTAAPGVLREDLANQPLGMPRDLNGSGGTDSANHAGDYNLLPVLVRVDWSSAAGRGRTELKTMLVAP